MDLTEAVAAFKAAWEAADKDPKYNQVGHRTEAGMAAAFPFIAAQAFDHAVASMRYTDGTPVKIEYVVNPYR